MQRPPPPVPRLSLLGRFALDIEEDAWPLSGPAERLMAYLSVVARDKPVGRAPVAERLWPDAPPSRAASSLRSVLWRLPRPRGRALVVCTSSTLRLSDELAVDLWEAERRVAAIGQADVIPSADDPSTATSGLTVLLQDLLPDWHDDWLLIEQENYRQLRLHALERIARRLCLAGRYTHALQAGLGAVRAEPLRETAHRAVIEVHLAEGNHAEALRQYERYRHHLADELGLHPSQLIRELVAPLLGRPADLPHRGAGGLAPGHRGHGSRTTGSGIVASRAARATPTVHRRDPEES